MLLQDFGKLVVGEKREHLVCSATLERQAEGHYGPFCLAAGQFYMYRSRIQV